MFPEPSPLADGQLQTWHVSLDSSMVSIYAAWEHTEEFIFASLFAQSSFFSNGFCAFPSSKQGQPLLNLPGEVVLPCTFSLWCNIFSVGAFVWLLARRSKTTKALVPMQL